MCDDYDTDFDSEPEEFDRLHLRDDIQRINLALAADSDELSDEDEDEDEEQESSLSKFAHFKTSNLTLPSKSNTTHPADPKPFIINLDEEPTYTELKTRNTTDTGPSSSEFSNICIDQQGPTPRSLLNSVQEGTPPTWTVEHELYNFASVQQEYGEDGQEHGISNSISRFSGLDRKVLQQCLARNREYQNQLVREIRIIDSSLAENKRKQLDLAQIKYNHEEEDENDLKALPSLHKFASPYFKDVEGRGPPDNEDAKQYRSLMAISAYERKPISWNEKEKDLLAEGVSMQNLKLKLAPLLTRLKDLESQRGVDVEEVENLKQQINKIKAIPPKELEENLEGLDWDKLSVEYFTRRSAMECKLEWCHFGHPRVNRKPWTKEEDKMLFNLAKGKEGVNWNITAQMLQTNRTPIECFRRYQRSLNKDLLRSKWTYEEDKQLKDLVKTFGMRNWQRIADFMDGRVGEQCMHRYMKACIPKKKGRWSDEESQKLKETVEKVGTNWEKVAEYISGRTGTQCRERYVNVVDPHLNKGAWSSEEDEKLLNLVSKYGQGNWSKIAKELVPRTDNQCWRRWTVVRRKEAADYRINTLRKKREMVSNFVGRKNEKPTLTPKDLDIQDLPVVVRDKESRAPKKTTAKAKESDAADKSTKTPKVLSDKPPKTPKSSTDKPKKPPQTNVKKLTKENVPCNDHNYAATVTKPERTPGNNTRTLKPVSKNGIDDNNTNALPDKGWGENQDATVVVFSSDDEWEDGNVDIDTTELGTRASVRKRNKNVSYTEKDELDFPVDDDVIAVDRDNIVAEQDGVQAEQGDISIDQDEIPAAVGHDEISFEKDDIPVDKDDIPVDEDGIPVKDTLKEVAVDRAPNISTPIQKTGEKPKLTREKKRGPKQKGRSRTKEVKTAREAERSNGNFLFLSIPSYPCIISQKQKAPVRTGASSNSTVTARSTNISSKKRTASTTTNVSPKKMGTATSCIAIPVQTVTTSTSTNSTPIMTLTPSTTAIPPRPTIIATPVTTAAMPSKTVTTTTTAAPNNRITSKLRTLAPKTVGGNTADNSSKNAGTSKRQSVATSVGSTQQIAKKRQRNPRKTKSLMQRQNATAMPAKQQGNVAPFSLLLQAFNINVAAVLQKLNPRTTSNTAASNQLQSTALVASSQLTPPTHKETAQKYTSQLQNRTGVQTSRPNITGKPANSTTPSSRDKDAQSKLANEPVIPSLLQSQKATSIASTVSTSQTEKDRDLLGTPKIPYVCTVKKGTPQVSISSLEKDKDESAVPETRVMAAVQSTATTPQVVKDKVAASITSPTTEVSTIQPQKGTSPTANVHVLSTPQQEVGASVSVSKAQDNSVGIPTSPTQSSLPREDHSTSQISTSFVQEKTSTEEIPSTSEMHTTVSISEQQNDVGTNAAIRDKGSPLAVNISTFETVTESPPRTNEDNSKEFRSPSRRKSTMPRKKRSELGPPMSLTPPPLPTASTTPKRPGFTNDNVTSPFKEVSSPSQKNNEPPGPLIPPLPPTLTTLKGLRNILAMKEQLQRLAAKLDPVPFPEKKRKSSSSDKTVVATEEKIPYLRLRNSREKTSTGKTVDLKSTKRKKGANGMSSPILASRSSFGPNTAPSTETTAVPEKTSANSKQKSSTLCASTFGQNTPPTHPSEDFIRTEDNEEIVVVHIDAELAPSESQSREGINAGAEVYTTGSRDDSEPQIESPSSPMTSTGESASNRVVSTHKEPTNPTHPSSANRSNIDPFVKFALYRKTPEYKLLSARFQSLFLWPMLMSEVAVSGKLLPTIRNQLVHVNQSPDVRSSQGTSSAQALESVTPNKRTGKKRAKGTSIPAKRSRMRKQNTSDIRAVNKRRKVVDNFDDSENDYDDIDDDYNHDDDGDYTPGPTDKRVRVQVAPARTLRSRKRNYKSALQTKNESNNATDDVISAKKRSNSSLEPSAEAKYLSDSINKPPCETFDSDAANESPLGSLGDKEQHKPTANNESSSNSLESTAQEPRESMLSTITDSNAVTKSSLADLEDKEQTTANKISNISSVLDTERFEGVLKSSTQEPHKSFPTTIECSVTTVNTRSSTGSYSDSLESSALSIESANKRSNISVLPYTQQDTNPLKAVKQGAHQLSSKGDSTPTQLPGVLQSNSPTINNSNFTEPHVGTNVITISVTKESPLAPSTQQASISTQGAHKSNSPALNNSNNTTESRLDGNVLSTGNSTRRVESSSEADAVETLISLNSSTRLAIPNTDQEEESSVYPHVKLTASDSSKLGQKN